MDCADEFNTVDEAYACLKELEEDPNRLIHNAKELEYMEQEIPLIRSIKKKN